MSIGEDNLTSSLLRPVAAAFEKNEHPSEEKVLSIHSELTAALGRKRDIEKSLLSLEVQLYNYESSFLEKYAHGINLIKEFSAQTFLSTSNESSSASASNRVDENLRIFSGSSTTSQKAIAQLKRLAEKGSRIASLSSSASYIQNVSKIKSEGIGQNKLKKKRLLSRRQDEEEELLFDIHRKKLNSAHLVISDESDNEESDLENTPSFCSLSSDEIFTGEDDSMPLDHNYKINEDHDGPGVGRDLFSSSRQKIGNRKKKSRVVQ